MNWIKLNSLWLLAVVFLMASCTEDTDDDPTVSEGILELEVSNLPDNGDNFDYYMWLVSGGVNISLGEFDVMNGLPSRNEWQLGDLNSLENATQVLISMSPAGITPTSPDDMVMLAADFGNSNLASFTTAPMTTDGASFSGSLGSYFLATPTTSTMSEEFSGLWFGDNTTPALLPGLNLPTLSEGWTYQGWINLGNDMLLRTGKFYNPEFADLESIYNGPLDGYDVPGEDFNQNLPGMATPPDLRGKEVWLTVQPDTFTDQLFALPIFRDSITTDVMTTTALPNVFPDFAGSVSRR